jgi:hypothetical protein
MARISTTEANQALATTGWAYVGLFTADPTTSGATGEVSGGTYARVAVTWNAASGGSVTNSNSLSINLPAATTASYFGVFSAITAGTYYVGGALSPAVTTGGTAGIVTIAAAALSVSAS